MKYTKEGVDSYGDKRVTLDHGKIVRHSLIGLFALIVLMGSFGIVDAGERGVKVRLGNVQGTVEPGVYFKFPFIEKVKKMNVRTQAVVYEREEPLASASADLQNVDIATVTNYHIDSAKVVDIYLQYQDLSNFEEKVIRPAIRDTVKATASKYTASELITKRAEFAEAVALTLNQRLSDKFIVVEQSNITNFEFSPSFSAAIEAKVTAQQNAEAAKNKLEQVKFEAQQKIETAKADAESIRIQAAAITSQGGEDYVKLQALKTWDGKGCTSNCFGANTQMPVPFLNVK